MKILPCICFLILNETLQNNNNCHCLVWKYFIKNTLWYLYVLMYKIKIIHFKIYYWIPCLVVLYSTSQSHHYWVQQIAPGQGCPISGESGSDLPEMGQIQDFFRSYSPSQNVLNSDLRKCWICPHFGPNLVTLNCTYIFCVCTWRKLVEAYIKTLYVY